MKKIVYFLAAILLTVLPANAAQKTKAQLAAEILSQLPTNGQGQISATVLRGVLQDMVDSDQQILLINAQTGTTYTFLAADQGKLVTFNNSSAIAVSLPGASGDFAAGWSVIAQNIGTGAVTITADVGTINGGTSITLQAGQIALLVSAGLNSYRSVQYGVMVSVTCGAGLSGGTITTSGTCSITDTITSASNVGSSSTVPIITYNSRGQLTTVTTATISAGSISAMPDPAGTGVAVKTSASTAVTRSITGTAGNINVTNGDGVSGNPTLDLANANSNVGSFGSGTLTPVLTVDAKGRITAISSATTAPPFSAVTGQATLAQLPTISSPTILSNISGGSATPGANSWSSVTDTITSTRGAWLVRGASGWSGFVCGTGLIAQSGGPGADPTCVTVAGTGTVTSISQGAGLAFSTNPLTTTGTISADIATNSNLWSATANKMADAAGVNTSLAPTTITQTISPVTIDLSTGVDFQVTLTTTPTFANPTVSASQLGRTGCLWITQPSTGSFGSAVFGSNWKFAGGTAPTLSTGASKTDVLCYKAKTTTFVWGALNQDIR